jgi:hypothetical protein
MWIKPVELFEQRKFHRRLIKPAQGRFIADAIQISGTVVHMTLRLQNSRQL